jgi:hypothetical protein
MEEIHMSRLRQTTQTLSRQQKILAAAGVVIVLTLIAFAFNPRIEVLVVGFGLAGVTAYVARAILVTTNNARAAQLRRTLYEQRVADLVRNATPEELEQFLAEPWPTMIPANSFANTRSRAPMFASSRLSS